MPVSREASPGRTGVGHTSRRQEERRDRLISNASMYRSPSLTRTPSHSRPHSPHSSIAPPHFPSSQPRTPEPTSQQEFNSQSHYTSTMRSTHSSVGPEFRPVHTVPDPLTGRYPDGRITPNHGYTRNFNSTNNGSPMMSRKVPSTDSSIPKRPEELLSSLGQEVDQREMARISQEETVTRSKIEMERNNNIIEPEEPAPRTINKPGPPVYYPTKDLYTKTEGEVATKQEGSKGEYFSASYAREKGSSSKHETGEKGGAAVVPICLPLCCAAPCSIM